MAVWLKTGEGASSGCRGRGPGCPVRCVSCQVEVRPLPGVKPDGHAHASPRAGATAPVSEKGAADQLSALRATFASSGTPNVNAAMDDVTTTMGWYPTSRKVADAGLGTLLSLLMWALVNKKAFSDRNFDLAVKHATAALRARGRAFANVAANGLGCLSCLLQLARSPVLAELAAAPAKSMVVPLLDAHKDQPAVVKRALNLLDHLKPLPSVQTDDLFWGTTIPVMLEVAKLQVCETGPKYPLWYTPVARSRYARGCPLS